VPPIATELMHRNQLTDVREPDSCSAAYDVAGSAYSITSPAIASSVGGTVKSGRLGGSSFDDRLDSRRLREGQACQPTRAANLFRFQLSF
jgi:hypothetical protein